MTDRRVGGRRRLLGRLAGALLGAACALTIVTPAHAATTCALALRAIVWPAADGSARWDVEATMTNAGTVQSTNWVAWLPFPYAVGAVIPEYWNVKKSPVSGVVWSAAAWNKILLPGASASFGFEVDMPSWDISPLPASARCSITY